MYGFFPYYPYYFIRKDVGCVWNPAKVELNRTLRALWEQHIYWTRLAVNSIVGQYPDQEDTIKRLLRNPVDFGQILAPLYGTVVADQFVKLFTEHLTIAAELVAALRDQDAVKAEDAQKRWFINADQIAELLSSINPFWSKADWQHMMYDHLKLLSEEVTARLDGDYAKNIATNDLIEPQALEMADVMTGGILKQFPSYFI
ncbi:acetylglutamate kinase [Paenibacillus sp. strain BS8-2]